MSRSITIGYRREPRGAYTPVEIESPYDLFGCQRPSMEFWALPRIRELGAVRLAELGVTDPVYFVGWDGMAELGREIGLLQAGLQSIDYYPELVARWLAHLVYCHSLLSLATPDECIPDLCIG